MEHRIDCNPGYSRLEVTLGAGEKIVSESGAMAWMDPEIDVETTTRGGIFRGLKRKILSGESFFQNTYTSTVDGARVSFVPGCPGDIANLDLSGELFLQKGAFLASEESVKVDSKWDGLRGFFNEGLFILRLSGEGQLFFNAYGDIQTVEVDGEYVVDNGYAVAWEPTLQYRLSRSGKIRSFLFSDQLLLRFSGRGRVWVQSRSPHAMASWVYPYRPKRQRNR